MSVKLSPSEQRQLAAQVKSGAEKQLAATQKLANGGQTLASAGIVSNFGTAFSGAIQRANAAAVVQKQRADELGDNLVAIAAKQDSQNQSGAATIQAMA